MKQQSLRLGSSSKRTRKREFLDEMERVVPWGDLVSLIAPYMPEGRRGRPPFCIDAMLRIHFMQQWFTLSDPVMEEALHDVPLFRDFAGLGGWDERLPDESTGLRFRHVLEEHKLAPQSTAGNVNDVVEAASLLHGQEIDAFGDAGYQGAAKRPDAKADVRWHIAMRPGKRAALKEDEPLDVLIDELERVKASIRAKVEHPFRVIKRQFGHVRVRYRGLKKNTAQLFPLFALSNLWMVRGKLLAAQG